MLITNTYFFLILPGIWVELYNTYVKREKERNKKTKERPSIYSFTRAGLMNGVDKN